MGNRFSTDYSAAVCRNLMIRVQPNLPIIILILLTGFHKFVKSRGPNSSGPHPEVLWVRLKKKPKKKMLDETEEKEQEQEDYYSGSRGSPSKTSWARGSWVFAPKGS